jgi:hypothetical protein
MFLRDSEEMVVTGREELDWVIKGISLIVLLLPTDNGGGRIDGMLAVAGQVVENGKIG